MVDNIYFEFMLCRKLAFSLSLYSEREFLCKTANILSNGPWIDYSLNLFKLSLCINFSCVITYRYGKLAVGGCH